MFKKLAWVSLGLADLFLILGVIGRLAGNPILLANKNWLFLTQIFILYGIACLLLHLIQQKETAA